MQPTSTNYWFVVSNLTFCCSAYLGIFRAQAPLIIASYPQKLVGEIPFVYWSTSIIHRSKRHCQGWLEKVPIQSLLQHSHTSKSGIFCPVVAIPAIVDHIIKNPKSCWPTHFLVIVMWSRLPRWSNNGDFWLLLQTGGIVFIICPAGHPSAAVWKKGKIQPVAGGFSESLANPNLKWGGSNSSTGGQCNS